MKIDEDLIYEQTEQIRDQIVGYIQTHELDDETNLFIKTISTKLKGLVKIVKQEQQERDSEYYQENDDRIARLDDEYNFLNHERIKNFEC